MPGDSGGRSGTPPETGRDTTMTPLPREVGTIVPGGADARAARRLIELVGPYVQGVLADVEVIVEAAASRARSIPDRPELVRQVEAMWVVLGEVLMRVAVLEADLQERDAERRRRSYRHGKVGPA